MVKRERERGVKRRGREGCVGGHQTEENIVIFHSTCHCQDAVEMSKEPERVKNQADGQAGCEGAMAYKGRDFLNHE